MGRLEGKGESANMLSPPPPFRGVEELATKVAGCVEGVKEAAAADGLWDEEWLGVVKGVESVAETLQAPEPATGDEEAAARVVSIRVCMAVDS